ncbi:hypothetical protein PGB90_004945 [Kerria lacca]
MNGVKLDNNCNEVSKLQQHLTLLKEEYVKLQTLYNEIDRKYALLSATSGNITDNTYVSRLVKVVSGLYDNPLYSDLNIQLPNRNVSAHKLVLTARSNNWGKINLSEVDSLDWTNYGSDIGLALLKWVYTDQVDFSKGEDFTLELIKIANVYELYDLIAKCEKALMALVNVRNCVRFYSTADEIGAETLKQHCSSLISTHWEDFTSEDFSHMSAPLLFHMFKNKTQFPLHSAIRLQREDVVFLYLVENNSQLSKCLNELDTKGELALNLALKERQMGIARTLLEHNADPDVCDSKGWTILHRAVERGDWFSARFLLEHGASISIVTPERGDTALHLIASSSPDTSPDDSTNVMTSVAKMILDKGLNPNLQNNQGFTPLHLAVMARNEELFNLLLLRENVDLNARTLEEHTPLYFALISTRKLINTNSFAARLVEKGADANPIYNRSTNSLLHIVADDCLEDAALFICSHADNINHTNKRGETALHIACEKGLIKLITRLLECGANPNIATYLPESVMAGDEIVSSSYRLTPILTSIINGHDAAVKIMLEYAASVQENNHNFINLNHKDSKGDSALSLAINMDMQHLILDLIAGGADINLRNGEGLTLLHQAILKNDSKTALFLLNQGANIDAKTYDNLTPLQLAIKCGVAPVVESLCKKGVDMSVIDENGDCPLWIALVTHQEDIASILVRYGVNIDFWSEGPGGCLQTLLHRAIDENNEVIARFLIQSGCDLNTPRKPGPGGRGGDEAFNLQTALHLCCSSGLETVVQALIEHEADVNAKDIEQKTPLHIAVCNQHPSIINLLLCHPAIDVSLMERDKAGLTPFATALTCCNDKAAMAILKKLPTAAEQFDNKGRNFLHMAIQKNDIESILFLLSIRVDVNSRVQDFHQTTPLHLAAKTGNEMLVRSLILAGAKINDKDTKAQTALHMASEAGHATIINALLSCDGIDFEALDSEGNNALHLACREGHLNAIKELLSESTINAEAVNVQGRTPLHLLAKYCRDNASAICELFIEFMPNYPLDKSDTDGNTALILAYMNGNGNLCRTLVKAGASVGAMNKYGITIFNYQVATKQLLHRLLDQLSKEPPWVEGEACQECDVKFGITMRKHHCRHCGRLLCNKCAARDIPILKYNINKPVRVCVTCFDVLQGSC